MAQLPGYGIMGFPIPPMSTPPFNPTGGGFMDRIGGLLGGGQTYGGILTPEDQKAARQRQMLAMGASLLQAGGPSPTKIGLGQALGGSMMAGMQAGQQANQNALQMLLLKSQVEKAKRQDKGDMLVVLDPVTGKPKYVPADKYNGEEAYSAPTNQAKDAASIQEYKLYSEQTAAAGGSPEPFDKWLARRSQLGVGAPYQIGDFGGTRGAFDRTTGWFTPRTTLDQESEAARRLKEAEARGAAFGKAGGELAASIVKKGKDAESVKSLLSGADALIDVATGSGAGAARDKFASTFGYSTEGAQAIAELQILQANLMLKQPRMEGPQGVLDVQLYQQMAGQIGDPSVPAPQKKAALRKIMELQDKYAQDAQNLAAPEGGGSPTPKRSRAEILKQYGL